jgi:hypothetical protein
MQEEQQSTLRATCVRLLVYVPQEDSEQAIAGYCADLEPLLTAGTVDYNGEQLEVIGTTQLSVAALTLALTHTRLNGKVAKLLLETEREVWTRPRGYR